MNRSQSRRSERSDTDVHEHGLEQELAKLQRQYRIMEGDRKAYSEESQNVIRKQKATIDKLLSDHEYLKNELTMAEQRQNDLDRDANATKRLEELKAQAEYYTKKIKQEQEVVAALDREMKRMHKEIAKQRSEMGGIHAASQNNIAVNKQIRVLENRLDKALVKFNESLAYNKRLREQIDDLRRERVVFDNIYKKLEKELAEQKKAMAEIIEASNQAYEARDEAQAKMITLKEKADKELAAYNMELKELTRVLEHDRKLKTFMGVKTQERAGKDGQTGTQDDRTLPKKQARTDAGKEAKAAGSTTQETVTSYEEAFARIREATGIQDIDKLVEKFIEVEDQNFSLFNYVNELNNEIEKLQEQIADIQADIEKFKGQGITMDNQRKKILKDLEEKLAATEAAADGYERRCAETSKVLNQLKTCIQTIFNRIGCDRSAITDMLGNAGVTETNMMQYLGIIEQRTNEILMLYN
eukprot:Colp12_sorted_trinity150504_noHs@18467